MAAAGTEAGSTDIWVHDTSRPLKTRLTFNSGGMFPVWTPDGSAIVFTESLRGKPREMVFVSADGGGNAQTVLPGITGFPMSAAPDGGRFTFTTIDGKRGYDLSYLQRKASGGYEATPLLATPALERSARIAPNGAWFAYASDETARDEVFVRPFASGAGRWQISVNGGNQPRWHPNGKQLFYVDGDSLMSAYGKRAAVSG